MNRHSGAVVMAERQVAEARTVVSSEYWAEREKLRRMQSAACVGGVLLGVIVFGRLVLGGGRATRSASPAGPGAWTQVLNTVQVLMPLWLAFNSGSKSPAGVGEQAR